MPILTKSGRIVFAESVAGRSLHLAWGSGDGSWTTPPLEDSNATSLLAEIGRREIVDKGYVLPDVAGSIITPSGNFTASVSPTKYLYLKVGFDYLDAPASVIREVAVFAGSTFISDLPVGQRYFTPAQVATPGRLLHLEHMIPIIRSSTARENFEIVIEF